ACRKLSPCETGQSVITPGFALKARHVIHTVGPIWRGGGEGEAALLASCYRTALTLAAEHGLRSIAFPLISAGIYGYPKEQALAIAEQTIAAFLETHPDLSVTLALL
ncbi:MAG: macro domain-containing protein, partial [Clostridia bacterium]|nr:macro domain-containing protein [Clostridia bacterium]